MVPNDESARPLGFDSFKVTLGDIMRGERATMSKSLLDVQRELKIKVTYISAIENTDPSAFESPGFIAGYVRSYARYLGLDPDDAYNRFCMESGFGGVNSDLVRKSDLEYAKSQNRFKKVAIVTGVDVLKSPRVPNRPVADSWTSKISASGLGSVAVLVMLIGALGYGGWTVLQEVQRVQFAPVNQTPGVDGAIAILEIDENEEALSSLEVARTAENRTAALDRLYRPQELDVPILVARDGPIAGIDPESAGTLITPERLFLQDSIIVPAVVEAGPPKVSLVASNPAWVRIYFSDGSILFEKILDAGEEYILPEGVEDPLLRAGNSGSVYLRVGDKTFGPAGPGTSVARKVPLSADGILENYEEIFLPIEGVPQAGSVTASVATGN